MAVSAPVRDAADPLGYGAQHTGTVVTVALLVLVVGLSLAFIPVVLFPVLRRVDGVMAVGNRQHRLAHPTHFPAVPTNATPRPTRSLCLEFWSPEMPGWLRSRISHGYRGQPAEEFLCLAAGDRKGGPQ